MATRQLTTTDGHRLTADIALPDGRPRAAVVVCHPHPLYGGNRFDNVVTAVFSRLPFAGFAALRFDFRRDHGGGEAEVLDVAAAIDGIAELAPDAPIGIVGYSFGAAVALRTRDDRIAAQVAIAPPLAMTTVPEPTRPTLVLVPEHDQFTDPTVVEPLVSAWRDASVEAVASADHFLAGHAGAVADRAVMWLGEQFAQPSATSDGD